LFLNLKIDILIKRKGFSLSFIMDTLTKAERSRNMSAIRSKNTGPEKIVRKFLRSSGFKYKSYAAELPGKPDFMLKDYNAAIFVQGCFWHHHAGCKYAHLPKSNKSFWLKKLRRNVCRDKKNLRLVRAKGCRAIVLWECELSKNNIQKILYKKLKILKNEKTKK
jgi:DNA mismatch endonuclease, patch repair protein